MNTPEQELSYGKSCPASPSGTQLRTTPVKESPFNQLERASKKVLCSKVKSKDRTVHNALAAVLYGSMEILLSRGYQDDSNNVHTGFINKDQPTLSLVAPELSPVPSAAEPAVNPTVSEPDAALSNSVSGASQTWLHIFPENIGPIVPLVQLPPPGVRLENTAQLAYCNHLLRSHNSLSSTATSVISLDLLQKTSVDAILQDKEEQNRILELTIGVIEVFAAESFKTSEMIAEVIPLGPFLDQEHHRKLLSCLIAEFEGASLLNIDLLQGMVELVQCAESNYLVPGDFVRILIVLRSRLHDPHRQPKKHSYYLALALTRILDVMVEGKVQDLNRIVDHEPLSALLGQLANSPDQYLKHQAAYALQALLHIPNDETRRQFMLRQAGMITMGLLGVASVCKLNLGEFKGVDHHYKATSDAHEVATKAIEGVQSLLESGQDIATNIKGGILSGGRQLWYSALREAKEHTRNGRLADFNRLVFEAPCCHDVEFQWGVCQLLGEIAMRLHWDVVTRHHAVDLLAELYKDESTWTTNKEIHSWILQTIRQ
ncbi:hypothetical protein BGZ95_005800, partial [Linnemannia exigua]